MSFLKRLFGKRDDPTTSWNAQQLPLPDFDWGAMQLANLRFGDPLDAAAILGRPDRFTWGDGDYCELLYARGGFQLDFDQGTWAYAAFFIGPDHHLPDHPAMAFARPRLSGGPAQSIVLSPEVDRARIEQWFGPAESADVDADEAILCYVRQGLTMEFELDGASGRLKRWNLFPE
ncbi:MAG: hypothetical protein C0483_14880 [Pirellula sp.]|nr:hypothetical protein [Pirellula sp.]